MQLSFPVVLLRPGMLTALALLCMLLAAPVAQAQGFDYNRSVYSAGGFYRYAETGDLTVRAQAWGSVRYPGLHEVPQGTSLSALLSLAGGPTLAERREQDDRTLQIRFYRTGTAGEKTLVFEQQMTNDIEALQEDPVLQDGDVLVVDSVLRIGYTWRDYLPIASVAASAVTILIQLLK